MQRPCRRWSNDACDAEGTGRPRRCQKKKRRKSEIQVVGHSVRCEQLSGGLLLSALCLRSRRPAMPPISWFMVHSSAFLSFSHARSPVDVHVRTTRKPQKPRHPTLYRPRTHKIDVDVVHVHRSPPAPWRPSCPPPDCTWPSLL